MARRFNDGGCPGQAASPEFTEEKLHALRQTSPVQTKKGAQAYEAVLRRKHLDSLESGRKLTPFAHTH